MISTLVKNRQGLVIAELQDNEWKVSPPPNTYDRNYTDDSLEVKDGSGDIVLQVRLLENRVQLQGKWYSTNGGAVALAARNERQKGAFMEIENSYRPLQSRIEPLFKYPSELHLGELR